MKLNIYSLNEDRGRLTAPKCSYIYILYFFNIDLIKKYITCLSFYIKYQLVVPTYIHIYNTPNTTQHKHTLKI